MADLYLQNIVNDICLEDLPEQWQGFDFSRFSKDKTLFDFQQKALENALRGLWLFYKDKNADKQSMFNRYRLNGLEEDLDYDLKKKQDSKTVKYLLEYDKDYPVVDSKISFSCFINRMSFWMATGSGKTLVIVKLIELLGTLMSRGEIPNNDILFLTYRDDLLDQFKSHVEEFNSNFDTKIKLVNLKEYDSVKYENDLPQTKNEITVFYYRSDLISDEQKAKIVNFRNYDNDGKWYVLLDEAHKGDKEDSKRQMLYSILSRNGFLFNFSATFTDPRDFATCVFNFNLAKFIEEGYGKHIYVSSGDIEAFRERDDFSSIEKQKIVLKTLLLLTYIDKHFEKIRDIDSTLYHRPLLLTLVNSVSVEDSDLELFFRELEKIAKGAVNTDLLQIAKEELIQEFSSDATFTFENIKCTVDTELISQLDYKDILRYVFNAETPGKIEVLKIPSNNKELVFRLMTADKPFALIKIGDISGWLKNKLGGYEINESFENESYFKRINDDDSDINILMGSRSFYEGWDSNRPNVILFINIGIGNDAKKFVLQSVGRGVRIEPLKHQRKRMRDLVNANTKQSIEQLLDTIKDWILPIESLYVFGTNANNLKEIIATLKAEKQEQNLGNVFILNPEAEKHLLLIPVYKTTENIVAETQKYTISKDNLDLVAQFFELIGDKIALVKYNCEPRVLEKAKETFNQREQYYSLDTSHMPLNPELILGRIFNYLHVQSKEVDGFKTLENEIVHFKRIKFIDGEKYDEIRKKVDRVSKYPQEKEDVDKLYGIVDKEEYDRKKEALVSTEEFKMNNQRITIEYLANHYYLPVIIPDQEKTNYLTHIINVESEIEFMEGLKNYLKTSDNVFSQFDWWMFSKLDETLDEVYIPYYNPKTNSISKFKPDFIFWMQKDNRYLILFIDPKGTEHTDAYRKIDGYSKIFETPDKKSKKFTYGKYTVTTKLLLKPKQGEAGVLDAYKPYWFDNFSSLKEKLLNDR